MYQCPICKDRAWLYVNDGNGEAKFIESGGGLKTMIVPCDCREGVNAERRKRYLERIDGLTPEERQIRFGDVENIPHADQIFEMADQRRGIITLSGPPGTGKTTMLICCVNDARRRNVTSVYATMTDLLDYLRRAYAPDSDLAFDSRWDLLVRCEVLALDEIDEFNATSWAMERFLRLIDERWRNMNRCLTICATNRKLMLLPEKIYSRLSDGRALQIQTNGPDMRPYLQR